MTTSGLTISNQGFAPVVALVVDGLASPHSRRAYEKALTINPNSADALYNYANAIWLEEGGKERDPAQLFRRALELDPLSSWRHAALGDFLGQNGRVAEVRPVIRNIQALFADALRPAYEGAGGNFAARYKAEPGRILAGIAAECGIMDFFQASDEPPLDALFDATLSAYRDVLAMTGDEQPTAADYRETNRHRARLVEWLMLEDIGIQFARKSGVPMSVIEAYGFPPQVRY